MRRLTDRLRVDVFVAWVDDEEIYLKLIGWLDDDGI